VTFFPSYIYNLGGIFQISTIEASKKRKRGANFSPFEKSTLLNLVHKYKNIVSNNKTDAVAVEEKEKCWKRITEEFNFEYNFSFSSTATASVLNPLMVKYH
jgi:hypothetical protein